MEMYYKRPQDVQTFNRNDLNNWKTSTPLVRTKRDGNILRVRPPGRKMQEMTTWLQTSTGSYHLGWKASTYNKKNMERTAFEEICTNVHFDGNVRYK